MNIEHIERFVFINIQDRRVLVTLGKGRDNWHIPTTERQGTETDAEALARCVKEQLGVEVKPGSLQYFATFDAHAHAHGKNPEKTDKAQLRLKCYLGEFQGAVQPRGELEKADFFWFSQKHLLTQPYFGVFDELQKRGLIE